MKKKPGELIHELLQKASDRVKADVSGKLGTAGDVAKQIGKSSAAGTLRDEYLKPFRVRKLSEGAYMIIEAAFSCSYLFVGETSALLIDTGIGVAGLKDTVAELADGKELKVVCTHASPWCVGGAGAFDKVYLAKEDLRAAKRLGRYKLRSFLFLLSPFRVLLKLQGSSLLTEKGTFAVLDTKQDIDLGGRTVHMEKTPAQTPGCVSFKDSASNIVISGSVAEPLSLMILPGAVALKTYGASLETVESMGTDLGKTYASHAAEPLHDPYTADLRILVKGLADDVNDKKVPIRVKKTDGFHRILVYGPYKVQQKPLKERLKSIWNGN